MLREIDLTNDLPSDLAAVLPRGRFDVDHAVSVVAPVCDAVRDEGEAALRRFSEQFDGVVPDSFRVPRQALTEALAGLDPQVRAALEVAIERRRRVAETILSGIPETVTEVPTPPVAPAPAPAN